MSDYVKGILIILLVLSPLFVPVAVTIVAAISERRGKLRALRLAKTRTDSSSTVVGQRLKDVVATKSWSTTRTRPRLDARQVNSDTGAA